MASAKRPRTLESFFSPLAAKKTKVDRFKATANDADASPLQRSVHHSYPFGISHLPAEIIDTLNFAPTTEPTIMTSQPDLDLLCYQPYIPNDISRPLFEFFRSELPFYRVKYTIKRGPAETLINTPRFTTAFGLDETACFSPAGEITDVISGKSIGQTSYKCRPRPIPECIDALRRLTEASTGYKFNFALVNYYATGNDSISYHSDDERFLGTDPAIASFTLGAKRDFLLKHKPTEGKHESETKPIKLPLASGDMVLMRGRTQSNWLHSIPKRKGGDADKGRINITFRRAIVKGGTENYYRYNVGDGGVWRWDNSKGEMVECGE